MGGGGGLVAGLGRYDAHEAGVNEWGCEICKDTEGGRFRMTMTSLSLRRNVQTSSCHISVNIQRQVQLHHHATVNTMVHRHSAPPPVLAVPHIMVIVK